MRPTRIAVLLSLGVLLTADRGVGAGGLERCTAIFAAHPEAEEGPRCFADLVQSTAGAEPQAAARQLEDLQERYPELPWLSFHLGRLKWPASEPLFRTAAGRFAERREAGGEVRARYTLFDLISQRNLEEAVFEVRRAAQVANASGDPQLIATVRVLEAKSLLRQGQLARAHSLLADSRTGALNGPDSHLRMEWLDTAGEVSFEIGRPEEARAHFEQLAALNAGLAPRTSRSAAPQIQYRLVRLLVEKAAEVPGDVSREEIVEETRKALAAYQAVGLPGLRTHWILGLVTPREEASRHFASCLANSNSQADRCLCLSGRARSLAEASPEEAQELIQAAMAASKQTQDPWVSTLFWGDRMRVSWRAQPLQKAIADSWEALNAVEELRRIQDPSSRAGLFSIWSDVYYGFSGRLLERSGRGLADMAQAFAVIERLRGRTLIDKLANSRAEPLPVQALGEQRQAILQAIDDIRKRVDAPYLPPNEKQNARQDLKDLEAKKSDIERQLQSTSARPPGGPSEFATLEEIQAALAPDEALLSFQVAPWKDWTGAFGGGAWLMVITPGATRVYPLPGREELRHRVSSLTSPLETYEESPAETGYLVDLYEKLLAPALQELPKGIHRLVILPDDDLHRLPFAALHPAGAPPLIHRYQITVAPSATLWREWRRHRPRPSRIPALALADPVGLGALPPLPHTAEEGKAAVEALGGDSVLRTREQASEAFLKSADLRPYGLLLLATHSVLEDDPEHSSVRLTPSAGGNGHFEVAQILELKMEGKVVVLSTCESAGGQILRGEGVMSLARAFFAAGAHTVVGSLWPIAEGDGELLFKRFYTYLGKGASIAAALSAAQRDRIADGAPLRAWAGFVVLGDGDLVPLPHGRRRSPVSLWTWALAGAALLGFLILWHAWQRRRRGLS